jgi:ABC-2 type transport system permease protein
MNWVRIAAVGGVTSYRALFAWTSPWILVPSLLVAPLAQILLFAYIGRAAGAGSDAFFVIGGAVQYSAVPCLFGMTATVVGERLQRTLGVVLASPAPRLPLLLGRALPVLLNGAGVALFGLLAGGALLGVDVPAHVLGPVALAAAAGAAGCVGLGLVNAAIGLRYRDTAVLSNVLLGALLLLSGAAVPPGTLPHRLEAAGEWLPLTHAIAAARTLAGGGALADAAAALALGAGYAVLGVGLLRVLEARSRRAATLELL